MYTTLKIAAVAVLALAVGVAIDPFRPHATSVGDAPPSPTPSPVLLPSSGTLSAGTYFINPGPDMAPARFTFAVPAGWIVSDAGGVQNATPEYPTPGWETKVDLQTWMLTHVFSDACAHTTLVSAGTTVEELTTALVGQPVLTASDPTDVTISGYPGQHIDLGVPADLDVSTCTNGVIRFWPGPGPDMSQGMSCHCGPGMNQAVNVIDVDGNRWVVATRTGPAASEQDRQALEDVLLSIQIESPATSASPASSGSPAPSRSPAPSGSPAN